MQKQWIFLALASAGLAIEVAAATPTINLEDIHWGFDAKPGLLFESQEQCLNAVTKALTERAFSVQKTLQPADGPTIFAYNADRTQKTLSKCLLDNGTVVTVVIGAGDNLTKAVAINAAVEKAFQRGPLASVNNWQEHLVRYPQPQKIPAMHAHLVLDAPSRSARIIKQIETPSLVGCAAYVDTTEGRFYMSEFSFKRYQTGHKPSWIFVFPSPNQP